MTAPGLVSEMVTVCALVYVPPTGLKVGTGVTAEEFSNP